MNQAIDEVKPSLTGNGINYGTKSFPHICNERTYEWLQRVNHHKTSCACIRYTILCSLHFSPPFSASLSLK